MLGKPWLRVWALGWTMWLSIIVCVWIFGAPLLPDHLLKPMATKRNRIAICIRLRLAPRNENMCVCACVCVKISIECTHTSYIKEAGLSCLVVRSVGVAEQAQTGWWWCPETSSRAHFVLPTWHCRIPLPPSGEDTWSWERPLNASVWVGQRKAEDSEGGVNRRSEGEGAIAQAWDLCVLISADSEESPVAVCLYANGCTREEKTMQFLSWKDRVWLCKPTNPKPSLSLFVYTATCCLYVSFWSG